MKLKNQNEEKAFYIKKKCDKTITIEEFKKQYEK